jgi:branched-chain amino acid aminotransferase
MITIAYLNGAYLPLDEAKISVTDSGFLYGFGCYETVRGYRGRVFRLNEHLIRLSQTAERLKLPVDIKELKIIITEILLRNDYENVRLRITITGGETNQLMSGNAILSPTILVTAVKYIPFSTDIYKKGFNVIITSMSRNSRSSLSEMKTICFLESQLAREEAHSAGMDDAIFLNEKGFLAEASSSNVFLISGEFLKTPRLGSGLLPGVTREVVLELAKKYGLNTIETDIKSEELQVAEEVFITNSMIEIMPVSKVKSKIIGSGRPGPITLKLSELYKDLVDKEAC